MYIYAGTVSETFAMRDSGGLSSLKYQDPMRDVDLILSQKYVIFRFNISIFSPAHQITF